MKTIIWVSAVIVLGLLFYKYAYAKQSKITAPIELQYETLKLEEPINMVYFQDGSGSIHWNGVEVIHSRVFTPYFNDYRRDIQLSFGVITDSTAKKLIPLELKAYRLHKPIIPDLDAVPYQERNELKRKFTAAQQKFLADSISYFSDRAGAIDSFRKQVDSLVAPYRTTLSNSTDLIPAITIADRVFNFCFASSASNYLILNSDGEDSRKRHPQPLKNKAEVILVNAKGNDTTSIENIITKSFQSTEQAIEFTLNNQN